MKWDFPYESRRAPVVARNVVATSQPLATQAGIDALRRGGNAVDAALAAAIALTVVEPCSNGVGSDAFACIWDGERLHGLNGSGKSPMSWTPERFTGHAAMPNTGWDSVTVPGAVDVWSTLSKRFGTLPFADLFRSAIGYARDGFHVGHETARAWHHSIARFESQTSWRRHFLSSGRAPLPGELFRNPDLARTLEEIAQSGGVDFYEGELAHKIAEQSRREGGALSTADLATHESVWVDPLNLTYSGVTVHELPPNGQGLAALIALGVLEHLDVRSMDPGGLDWTHFVIEAMKLAIRESFRHFSDPDWMDVTPESLIDSAFTARLAASVHRDTATASTAPPPAGHDTVYLCTADDQGKMVSYIQSNYMGFGSGVVVDGTGIALQNRGAGFTLEPGHPNEVNGGKRPFHTIIPGFVSRDGNPLLAFGVMGGHMQHQGHVQMVTRIFDHDENPQAASDAPRWHVSPDGRVDLEAGFSRDVAEGLANRGHQVSLRAASDRGLFGGAQLIYRLSDGYIAASDHRKEGQASGF